MASVLLSASVERCFVSRMRDFLTIYPNITIKTPRNSSIVHFLCGFGFFSENVGQNVLESNKILSHASGSFFQIKYLFIFYTLLREFYKCLLVQKYKDYMDVE